MIPEPTVSTHAIAKHFGSVPAVDGVDMAVTGGVVGLLGPNGAGKTTLLRMLATVLAPDSGHLRLLGLDPARAGDRLGIRRQLGYLPQEPGLYPGFSAFDLVDYVAVLKEMSDRDARRDETRRVLELVGLSDVMHRRIRTLSGGTRHRVALAAALLGSPALLLMDEPAAGLDPEHRLRLRSILSEAGTRGTVILATHHTAEAAALCQQVMVMLDGRLCFVGSPASLAALAENRSGWTTPRLRSTVPVESSRGSPPRARSAASASRRPAPTWSSPASTMATYYSPSDTARRDPADGPTPQSCAGSVHG
jgi:ABC-2 type transport system ATP-binding protein